MKSKINHSRFSTILTVLIYGLLFIGYIATVHEKPTFFIWLSIYIFLIISGLLYGAVYVKVSPDYILLGSIMKCQKIPIRNVESVEQFQPTMGAIRIFGSGGFMGYWGIFREGNIGKYYAFYGKSSECFLVRMKNGDKYVLGCDHPNAMIEYIKKMLKT